MREAHIVAVAREVISDEQVLAAGILQPQGAMEGMSAGLVTDTLAEAAGAGIAGEAAGIGSLAAGRIAADPQSLPRWTLVAVTPTKVHLLSVQSTYLLNARHPRPFALIERANAAITRKAYLGTAVYVLTDSKSGREYRLECSRRGDLANGNAVMQLIAGDEMPRASGSSNDPS